MTGSDPAEPLYGKLSPEEPQRTYINVEFRDGVDLNELAHQLEGTGKTLRHVKVRTAADAHTPELRALLVEAARRRGL